MRYSRALIGFKRLKFQLYLTPNPLDCYINVHILSFVRYYQYFSALSYFKEKRYINIYYYYYYLRNISSRLSRSSKAKVSEFLGKLEEM